ncbi:hypothetical protein J7J84_06265 [bacterium]|nr:hypothetical protein [bacterium]
MRLIRITLCVAALACGWACGGTTGGDTLKPQTYFPPLGSGLYQPIDGFSVSYAVFVEDIHVPEAVYEGEPFQITAEVSAEFRPIVLLGNPCWRRQGVFTGEQSTGGLCTFPIDRVPEGLGLDHDLELTLGTGVANPPGSGPLRDRLVFDCPGLPAGQHLIRYFTVTERRFGGVGAPQPPPESGARLGDPEYYDSVVIVELLFTVLPSRESVE